MQCSLINDTNLILNTLGGEHQYSLNNILNSNNYDADEEFDIIKHSPYYSESLLIDMLQERLNDFTLLSLNIQSLNSKFDELEILIENLRDNNCTFSAIVLQETWLSDNSDTSLYNLDDYNMISQGKICSNHSGLTIYLHKTFQYRHLNIVNNASDWDSQFIEIYGNALPKNIIIGNIYRPPREHNSDHETFLNEFAPVLSNLSNLNKEVVIVGDFNINLLKVCVKNNVTQFFDLITSNSFFPQITLPTRLSSNSGTLIDNILYKLSPASFRHSAGILLNNISDHQPYFICIDLAISHVKSTPSKYIEIKSRKPTALDDFIGAISNSDIYSKLNKHIDCNPNYNYSIIEGVIKESIVKHFPTKTVKYNKHRHKKNKWITKGIIKSIAYRDRLYMKLKQAKPDSNEYQTLKVNLSTYNKMLKHNIQLAKRKYYFSCFEKYKYDIKNTWCAIRDILKKGELKSNFPENFKINNCRVSDSEQIANKFS